MSERELIYSGATTRFDVGVSERDEGRTAVLDLRSCDSTEGLPIWQNVGRQQLNDLVADLKHHFGAANVRFEEIPGEPTTDRRLAVSAKAGDAARDHVANVIDVVRTFVEEHHLELDTGEPGPKHFTNLVSGASAMRKLKEGIKFILEDQWLDNDKKTDAIVALMKQRREDRGGREGH